LEFATQSPKGVGTMQCERNVGENTLRMLKFRGTFHSNSFSWHKGTVYDAENDDTLMYSGQWNL